MSFPNMSVYFYSQKIFMKLILRAQCAKTPNLLTLEKKKIVKTPYCLIKDKTVAFTKFSRNNGWSKYLAAMQCV